MKMKRISIITGFSLLVMAAIAVFSYGFVLNVLYLPEDINQSLENILGSLGLFRWGIVGWIIIMVLDVVIALGFYRLFQNSQPRAAFVLALIRIIYAIILGIGIANLVRAGISPSIHTVGHYIPLFSKIYSYGLILFGFHLLILGMAFLKARNVGPFWGGILTFAGICYTLIHAFKVSFPDVGPWLSIIESVVAIPMAFAEIGLGFWLILWGKSKWSY